jgi:hypothetical protein
VARFTGIENERDTSVDQPARDRRRRFGPETKVENRHCEIAGVRPQHRLVQRLAEADNHRARLDQSDLQIHRQQRVVFDDEHSDAAQLVVTIRRLNHRPTFGGDRRPTLIRPRKPLPKPNTRHAHLFRRRKPRRSQLCRIGTSLRPAELFRTIVLAVSRWGFAVTEAELLQFEVIRTIAASLISVAIVLLWLVALSRQ